jgi:predicted metal-dependent hydrolase
MDFDWTRGDLAEGLQRYEAGAFFSAHEAWEDVWLHSQEPDKTFLQALIQLTAARYHLQRKNKRGAMSLLQAACGKLERYPVVYGGVSVAPLCDEIRDVLLSLAAGDEPRRPLSIQLRPNSWI